MILNCKYLNYDLACFITDFRMYHFDAHYDYYREYNQRIILPETDTTFFRDINNANNSIPFDMSLKHNHDYM